MEATEVEAIKVAVHLWLDDEIKAETIADYIYSLRDQDYTIEDLQKFIMENES
mgnify:CR=1 FL=1